MKYKIITPPSSEPVTLTEVKNWIKVDYSTDDSLINALIQSTREAVELHLGRILFTTVIEEAFDFFPAYHARNNPLAAITLGWGDVQSIDSITYKASEGSEVTLSSDSYIFDSYSQPGCITPVYAETWPTALYQTNAVKVRYTAGQDDVANISAAIKTAILKTVADAYDRRQDSVRTLPTQAEWLLNKYRIMRY